METIYQIHAKVLATPRISRPGNSLVSVYFLIENLTLNKVKFCEFDQDNSFVKYIYILVFYLEK